MDYKPKTFLHKLIKTMLLGMLCSLKSATHDCGDDDVNKWGNCSWHTTKVSWGYNDFKNRWQKWIFRQTAARTQRAKEKCGKIGKNMSNKTCNQWCCCRRRHMQVRARLWRGSAVAVLDTSAHSACRLADRSVHVLALSSSEKPGSVMLAQNCWLSRRCWTWHRHRRARARLAGGA